MRGRKLWEISKHVLSGRVTAQLRHNQALDPTKYTIAHIVFMGGGQLNDSV